MWPTPEALAAFDAFGIKLPYDPPPPWDGGTHCTGRFTPGARRLSMFLKANFPGIVSVGGYACRPNTANPRETSVHGTGRALDLMIPTLKDPTRKGRVANEAVGDVIANWLVAHGPVVGVQFVIWNHLAWSGKKNRASVYRGPVPHIDHIHLELTREASVERTRFFAEFMDAKPLADVP